MGKLGWSLSPHPCHQHTFRMKITKSRKATQGGQHLAQQRLSLTERCRWGVGRSSGIAYRVPSQPISEAELSWHANSASAPRLSLRVIARSTCSCLSLQQRSALVKAT